MGPLRPASLSYRVAIARLIFIADTFDWQYDNSRLDDQDYRYLIAHGLSAFGEPPGQVEESSFAYAAVEEIWHKIDAPAILRSSESIEFVRSIANEYFRAWSGITLKWKALKQRPIPDDWYVYTSRSSLRERLRVNRGATHPVNAMLNYAYGVLVSQTQIGLIAEGYDPTLGIMHDRESDRGGYPAFALDRMEPMRPVVDRAVLHLISSTTFTGADFSIQPNGVCRLNPELARRVAQLTLAQLVDGDSFRSPTQ